MAAGNLLTTTQLNILSPTYTSFPMNVIFQKWPSVEWLWQMSPSVAHWAKRPLLHWLIQHHHLLQITLLLVHTGHEYKLLSITQQNALGSVWGDSNRSAWSCSSSNSTSGPFQVLQCIVEPFLVHRMKA